MQTLFPDLKFVFRQLRKSPGFTVTAVLMLAFGIGATTAIFSIVEGVLLRPLPFPNSDRLMELSDRLQGVDVGGKGECGVTAPDIRAYTRDTHSFAALGGYQFAGYELSGVGEPAQVSASRLAAGVFSALGVAPLLGRVFTAEEAEHSQQVAVLSYTTWQERFNGDTQILGTKILLDRKPYLVIGVMPRNFEFPLVAGQLNRVELWVPMSFTPQELSSTAAASWSYRMVGRLKPGVSPAQAQSDAQRVAQEIMRNYPADMASLRISSVVRPLQEETVEQCTSAAADALPGGGGGAFDRLLQLGGADAGARDSQAARNCRSPGAGRERDSAAAPGDAREPGLERERRCAGIDACRAGAARRQKFAAAKPAAHRRNLAELECGWVCAAACGEHGSALRIGSGVCRSTHQRKRHTEGRRA